MKYTKISLKYTTYDDKYVAIDYASGGYPYPTDIRTAHDFQTKEKALAYMPKFGQKFMPVAITFEETELD
jgi:hypothetical protein